jgi:hypothetical protein
MKAILCILFVFTGSLVFSQVKPTDVVKFETLVYDFGSIKQGVPVNFDFKFKNISKTAVTISSATASCGCTTPTWPQAPVLKGKTNVVKAGFNAASAGGFDKTITVKLDGIDQPLELKIKGTVLSADEFAKLPKTKSKRS